MTTVATLLTRIETDLASLKMLVIPPETTPAKRKAANGDAKAKPAKAANGNVKIPTIKDSYTEASAVKAKKQIDAAFDAGLITYDKRRGLKMLVTKHTQGWSPT